MAGNVWLVYDTTAVRAWLGCFLFEGKMHKCDSGNDTSIKLKKQEKQTDSIVKRAK